MGKYRQQSYQDTFSETMGEQDSYRETFALWVGNTQVSGSDHSGEFRIGGRGQVNCNTLWEKWTCLQVCKHGCKKVKGISITKKSVDWHSLSIRLRGYNGKCQWYEHLSVRERKRGNTAGKHTIPFKLTSNYINKVNIICISLYIIVMIDISTTTCSSPMSSPYLIMWR